MHSIQTTSRRHFISQSGMLLAASALPVWPWQRGRSLGVALVGLGYYSTDILAPALLETMHCHLAGIVTGSPEKIPVWQQRYGIKDSNVYHYDNMDQIANNDEIDVIYIVLPPSMHAEYSIKAANAGKHVWCEKPMAMTATECQSMIDACRKNKVQLTVGYRMQHEPNTQTIMAFAREKPFGPIGEVIARAGYPENRTNHWKQQKAMGGGAMYDMGVYPLNAARYTAGEEPIAVSAQYKTKRTDIYHEVDEITAFTLEFPSGAVSNCLTSFSESINELRANCAEGWYELKPFQAYSGIKGQTSNGQLLNKSVPNQQAKQMDDDALAIMNNTAPIVPGEEGMRDIAIVEAIHQSASEDGKRVIL